MFLCDSQPRLLPQPLQHRADIPIDADAARGDVIGRVRLTEVYAGVDRLGVLRRHVPERVFYNDRGVVPDPELQKQYLQPGTSTHKSITQSPFGNSWSVFGSPLQH